LSALASLLLSFKQIATLTTGKLSPPYSVLVNTFLSASMVTDIRKVNNPFVEQTLKKLEYLLFLKKTKAYL
jgi:hypothetical protein